jgi:hypothetical protein
MAIILPEGTMQEIIKVTHFADATTNITTSNASNQQPLAWSVNRANGTSNLLLIGMIPVPHQNSNGCGEYVSINNVKKYGIGYAYPDANGDDGTYGVLTVQGLWTAAELGTGTGNMTVGVGWTSRDGTAQQLGNYWNPYRRAGRREHNQCQMTVFEILGTTQVT